ncbi:PREDICTED: zinc finger MYM-type protein 5 [Dipodomys ordii]|uniref:Zinc finger MYM-type protein 5 n=1 Tax=Dipodomys ordii TaxID=10020 RepID=A0A1S3ET83_DIPOR|nr:PREDICTED: zinc finger MYM-type protein 5 [Dipodomys ordii]
MDKHSVGGLELTDQSADVLENTAMAAGIMDIRNSFGHPTSPLVNRSINTSVDDDDDVVFIESIHPPSISAPGIADQRNFLLASSKHEKPQGNYTIILPSSRDLPPQKGNICDTIVIDDEEDIETDEGQEKNCSTFTEWGLPGTKTSIKDLDFSTSSLSRSKTKTGVRPFNPGRMNIAGDVFQNGRFTTHHNPDSWISQSASFPRNQKQPGMDSLSPVALLPKQNFQTTAQQQLKPAKITCANCKEPLQKGQTAYQRKGSPHLFCCTTCLSSFSRRRTRRTRNIICKKEMIRHEVSVNNVTHKLCSNHCFNEYRLANGLVMNCCEQCGEYLPSKNIGNSILIGGQQKRFCCQSCINEYKQIMETKSKALSTPEIRKRNSITEENETKSFGSSDVLLEKIDEIPEKKEKATELQVSAECSPDILLSEQNVNLPSMSAIADKFQKQLENKESEDPIIPVVLSADPGTWPRVLDIKQRDALIENEPPQVRNFNFPKDNTGRKFSETYYTRILPSGEKTTRSWLLYSASKDSVFCLYCKLFGEGKNQLKNENGCKDWQHLSHILSKHEESEMHIINSVKYSKLKSELENNKSSESAEHRLYENEKSDGVVLLYT